MADDSIQVEAARIPDRDRLLEELRKAGLDARPVDEVGIEVRSRPGRTRLPTRSSRTPSR